VLVPAINRGETLDTIVGAGSRYNWLGNSMGEMIVNTITKPYLILGHINRPDILRMPLYLLLSGGIAAWRGGRRMLVVLLPTLAIGLLANWWVNRITGTYYWITAEAVIVLACVAAAERRVRGAPPRTPWSLVYLAGATGVFFLLLSPLPFSLTGSWDHFALPPERGTLEVMRKLIPADASLSVQNNLGPHLAHRADVSTYPRRLDTSKYALFYLRYVGGPDNGLKFKTSPGVLTNALEPKLIAALREMVVSKEWGIIAYQDGFYLFERDSEDRVSRSEALRQIRRDGDVMLAQVEEASKHIRPWSRYLVYRYSWFDVLESYGVHLDVPFEH
jgi:hypothetical protein